MKRIYNLIVGALMLLPFFTSCEDTLPVYDSSQSWLKFTYEYASDSIISRSFAYGPSSAVDDTVKVKLLLMGDVSDHDRPFRLKQIATGEHDAVADKHYVSFDDEELVSKFYILPAGAIEVEVPIVLKRDPSLKLDNYNLKFTVKETQEFSCGSKEWSSRRILIADKLVKPNNWGVMVEHFFGKYGPVKHQFMIDVSGEKWDEEYVEEINEWGVSDQSYLFYLSAFYKDKLEEYNATHDKPLCEEGNEPVAFGF